MILEKELMKIVEIKNKVKKYTTGSEPVTNQTNYMVAAMLSSTIAAAAAYATGAGKLEVLLVFFSLFVIAVLLRGVETDKNINRDTLKLQNQLIAERNTIEVMKARVALDIEHSPVVDRDIDEHRGEEGERGPSGESDADSVGISVGDSSGNIVEDRGYRISLHPESTESGHE